MKMEFEIVWQEHELGNYLVIVLTREDSFRGVPWNYIERCAVALTAYENGGELPPGRTMQPVGDDDEDIEDEPFDPNKPPEPPDTLDFFEWQRSISIFEVFPDGSSSKRAIVTGLEIAQVTLKELAKRTRAMNTTLRMQNRTKS